MNNVNLGDHVMIARPEHDDTIDGTVIEQDENSFTVLDHIYGDAITFPTMSTTLSS